MPNTINSTYMDLPIPVPTVDPGPQWATDINSCLTLIDQHDHSSGKGVSITPAGLNINLDLDFGGNNATGLKSTRFTAQSAPLAGASDLGAAYVSGVDLYFNDVNGNQIRMTSNGSIAGTSGSIGNLVSPASVTYVSGTSTYVFQSAVNTPGKIDASSIIVRELVVSGKGVTLTAPSGLAANYSLTFPGSVPASQKIVTIDNSGNVAANYVTDNSTIEVSSNTIQVKDAGITTAKIANGNVTYLKMEGANVGATSLGNLPVSNSASTVIGQLTFTTRTSSCTIIAYCANGSFSYASNNAASDYATFTLTRDDVTVGSTTFGVNGTLGAPKYIPNGMILIQEQVSTPGTYTYKLVINTGNAGGTATVYSQGAGIFVVKELI